MASHRASRAARLAAALIGAAFILTAPVAGAQPVITADLDGRPIKTVEVARYHCHDLDFPVVHCYGSDEKLTAAISLWDAKRALDLGVSPDALAAVYVRVYEHAGYSGASLAISSSNADLGSLGWNDRITSFISVGLAGKFYEHVAYRGSVYPFTVNQSVSNVGDAWNDRISSVWVP